MLLIVAICFLYGIGYHLTIWQTKHLPSPAFRTIYALVLIAGYSALWAYLSLRINKREPSPAKTFWTALITTLLFLGATWLILIIPPASTAANEAPGILNGIPIEPVTVLKINLLGLLGATFAFLLILRLRNLVLYKRTTASIRNWRLMLALMAAGSLVALVRHGPNDEPLLIIAWLPALGLMVMNSFRVSWMVYLTSREKMATMGVSVLLLLTLLPFFPVTGFLDGADRYVQQYSFVLYAFIVLSVFFGVLYCTTTVLSLLFHLPTTGAFQQKVGEVAAIHSLTSLVSQVFDTEKLFETITTSPVEAGSAHRSWLAVPDPQSGTLRPHIVATCRIDAELLSRLVDTTAFYEELFLKRQPILLEEATADHRLTARPGDGIGSLLAVPLLARDELLGALFITKNVTHGFEREDNEALYAFAAQAALALDHARLFAEQVEKERLAREIDIARAVQRKLLPQHLPQIPGVSIAASSVFAEEVGGDYYDFIELDDHRLGIIIGDVSGKGTQAAFYMAEMQGIFQSVSRIATSPSEFLGYANEALSRCLEKHIFISVIYGILDLQKEEFWLARAGHCPAATINLNGEARYMRSHGLGLGLDRSSRFRASLVEERHTLQPGDVFVLYTDGVVESRNSTGEEYGYERLLNALRENRHEDASQLHNALLGNLQEFTGHQCYDDDMTLVVLKWHGIGIQPVVDQALPRTTSQTASIVH